MATAPETPTSAPKQPGDAMPGFEQQPLGFVIKVRPMPKEHTILPLPLQIAIIAVLLLMSGLFSGLNLGLMSLDNKELKIVEKCGNDSEKRYAKQIIPIRRSGNYLLCTLLLGNVLVNAAISILMDDLSNGLIALFASSLGIVVFGEIVPQSICSRYGLAVGAKTRFITMFFMVVTFPLSFPISKILDKILGDEPVQAMQKERLAELLKQSDVSAEPELAIATGALKISDKTVKDVMTDIRYVYKIPADSVLDLNTVNDIVNSGYTRIPVFEEGAKPNINVVGLLNVKDLALLDPGDRIPVQTVCQYYRRPVRKVLDSMPLINMMEEFKAGRYHMAFVETFVEDPNGTSDPYYELVGCVTLEDIIEEILQAEILDETDMITDNKRRIPVVDREGKRDLTLLVGNQNVIGPVDAHITKQVCMAAFQTLITSYPAFSPANISEHVLQRLILQHVHKMDMPSDPTALEGVKPLYKKGEPTDLFVLILEGHITVKIGQDDNTFDAGPFHCFGRQTLENIAKLCSKMSQTDRYSASDFKKVAFKPDFTTIFSENVTWFQVNANAYYNAHRSTLIERTKGNLEIQKIPRMKMDSEGSAKDKGKKKSTPTGSLSASGSKRASGVNFAEVDETSKTGMSDASRLLKEKRSSDTAKMLQSAKRRLSSGLDEKRRVKSPPASVAYFPPGEDSQNVEMSARKSSQGSHKSPNPLCNVSRSSVASDSDVTQRVSNDSPLAIDPGTATIDPSVTRETAVSAPPTARVLDLETSAENVNIIMEDKLREDLEKDEGASSRF